MSYYVLMTNSKSEEIVNSPEIQAEVRRLEDDPALILALVDLIFMEQDGGRVIPS